MFEKRFLEGLDFAKYQKRTYLKNFTTSKWQESLSVVTENNILHTHFILMF